MSAVTRRFLLHKRRVKMSSLHLRPSKRRNILGLSLTVIEQISNEQLLPVKMTRFCFTASDERSDNICTHSC